MKSFYTYYTVVFLLLGLISPFSLKSQTFTEASTLKIPGISSPSIAWGDYNNDGLPDFIIEGSLVPGDYTGLYKNLGNNQFEEVSGTPFIQTQQGSLDWGDYDNDGDLDILHVGISPSSRIATIYRNDGNNVFVEISTPFEPSSNQKCYWGDYDNDGWQDVLLVSIVTSIIYKNNGNGTFTKTTALPKETYVAYGNTAAWGDYDNDGYQDIVVGGSSGHSSYPAIMKVFRNNGNGSFLEQKSLSLTSLSAAKVNWVDLDNDGYLDLVTTGGNSNFTSFSLIIYKNNGDNTFTEKLKETVPYPSILIGDYDNDGFSDIILSSSKTTFYKNKGNFTFTYTPSYGTYLSLVDQDSDGDLDLIYNGFYGAKIYNNNGLVANKIPAAPTNLFTSVTNGTTVNLNWNKAIDVETPQNGLNYNVYIYEEGKTTFRKAPEAFKVGHARNGKRQLIGPGKQQYVVSGYPVNDLPTGNYKWSVQAIDAGNAGGPFAAEGSFSFINLSAVGIHASNGQIINTNPNLQYSFNSTNGTNGSWTNCTEGSTNVNFGNGGFDIWVRHANNTAFYRKVATLPVQQAAPSYKIDFANIKTVENIPSTVEYATSVTFVDASIGNGSVIKVTPGTKMYFRVKGSANMLPSAIQTLVVPPLPPTPSYSVDYSTETTAEIIKVTDQYSTSSGMSDAWGAGTKINVTPGQNLYFKTPATATSFASLTQRLYVPYRPATPEYGIDYIAETTNMAVASSVVYSSNSSMESAVHGKDIKIKLHPGQTLYFMVPATASGFQSKKFTLVVPERRAAPSFTVDYFAETTVEVATSSHRYSTGPSYSSYFVGNGNKIKLNPSSEPYYLYIWHSATSSSFVSSMQQLLVKSRPFTPSYEIDFITEKTTTFISSYDEYSYNADMRGATTGTLTEKAVVVPGSKLYIRAKATNNRFASVPQVLNAPSRPVRPTYKINYMNEVSDKAISVLDEYADNIQMTSAADGEDQVISIQPGQSLYFRTKATATSFASEIQSLKAPQRPVSPTFTIDFVNETITQLLASTDEYSTNSNFSMISTGTGSKVPVRPGENLYFRKKATAYNYKSEIQTLIVPTRPVAPAYTINFLEEKTNEAVPATEEYSQNATMTTAVTATGNAVALTPGQTTYFRKKATSTSFASMAQKLNAPARPGFSGVVGIDYMNETTLEAIPESMEYSESKSISNAIEGANSKISLIPGYPLYFRNKASSTSFASEIFTLEVDDRPAVPEKAQSTDGENTFGWIFNPEFNSISNYEFTTDAGIIWNDCSSNPIEIGNIDLEAGMVQVRVKASGENFKSDPLISDVIFTKVLGIDSFEETGISLYPNPAMNQLNLNGLSEAAILTIYTVDGKLVRKYKLQKENNTFDVSDLKEGIYLLKLQGSTLNTQIRLLKH